MLIFQYISILNNDWMNFFGYYNTHTKVYQCIKHVCLNSVYVTVCLYIIVFLYSFVNNQTQNIPDPHKSLH